MCSFISNADTIKKGVAFCGGEGRKGGKNLIEKTKTQRSGTISIKKRLISHGSWGTDISSCEDSKKSSDLAQLSFIQSVLSSKVTSLVTLQKNRSPGRWWMPECGVHQQVGLSVLCSFSPESLNSCQRGLGLWFNLFTPAMWHQCPPDMAKLPLPRK